MMRKYFPLEASERLFVAIEEDDVVDAQVSLPPTIALSCTTEIIHDNYALLNTCERATSTCVLRNGCI